MLFSQCNCFSNSLFPNVCSDLQDGSEEGSEDTLGNVINIESAAGIKLKRQLTRGSSEKLMLVSRFKKQSGNFSI